MLNADGTELRQRAAAKALNERVNYEQDILTRRRKMAEEDRTPTNPWIIVGFIVMFFVCLWAGWFFIIRHGKHWIIDQIHYGKVETVRMFLQEHHDLAMIDALDAHHEALIHHAVESNQPEIVSLLVEYGAKVSVKNSHGQMPLHLAVYHGWPKMVKTLVEHGAPLTVPDDYGHDPLSFSKHLMQNNPTDPNRVEVERLLEEEHIKRSAAQAARGDDGLGE